MADASSLYALTVNRLDGTTEALSKYEGKVTLVVNTASACGFTPQYAGLEKLWEELAPKGLVVLGFPSNDFGKQEPGSAGEIADFCQKNYGVTFPLFEKVKTAGDDASPVFKLAAAKHGAPKWNFHKYLVDKHGQVVAAFPSSVKPDAKELREAIEKALAG
jgi:glutathione peroxidase